MCAGCKTYSSFGCVSCSSVFMCTKVSDHVLNCASTCFHVRGHSPPFYPACNPLRLHCTLFLTTKIKFYHVTYTPNPIIRSAQRRSAEFSARSANVRTNRSVARFAPKIGLRWCERARYEVTRWQRRRLDSETMNAWCSLQPCNTPRPWYTLRLACAAAGCVPILLGSLRSAQRLVEVLGCSDLSTTLCHSLPLSATLYHSLPLSATLCHSLPLSTTLYHSLPLSATLCRSLQPTNELHPCTTTDSVNPNQMVLLIYPRDGGSPSPSRDDLEGQGLSLLGRTPARIIGELLDVPTAGVAQQMRAALRPLAVLEAVWNRPMANGIAPQPDVD